MNFGPIAKMISGAAAGGGATMFMDFLGTSGIKPAIKMGGSEVSLNTVLIMGVIAAFIYFTKNKDKSE
tara:strand:+ start:1839 stop:2042 length:204 start_codon:yes stop_codon:yes gene_type:complete